MIKIRYLKDSILLRILLKKRCVFLREDFEDLGGYDQVGRALKNLTREGEIMKIGYGLYTKVEVSPLSGVLIPLKNLPQLAKEALERLGIETGSSAMEKDYNSGQSMQVPTGRLLAVKSRINRKIGYRGNYVSFERIA